MAPQNQQVVKVKWGTKVKTLSWMLELPWQDQEINVHYIFSGNVDLCKLLKNYLLIFLLKLYKLKKSSGSASEMLIFPPLSISTTERF